MDSKVKEKLLAMDLQFFADKDEDNQDDPGDEDKSSTNKSAEDSNKTDKSKSGASGDDLDNNAKPQITEEMKRELIEQGKLETLKELGLDKNDESKKFIEFFKSYMENQNEQPGEETADALALKQELEITEAKVEALKNGVKAEYVDDVVTLALNKKEEDEKLEDVVINLKSKYDFFFGADEDDDEAKGTGSSRRDRKKKVEVDGIGARLAAQRKPRETKKSYW